MKIRHFILLLLAVMIFPETVFGLEGDELLFGTWQGTCWEDNNPGKQTSFTWEIWKDSRGNIQCSDGCAENLISPDTTRISGIKNGVKIVAPWVRKDPTWHGEYQFQVLGSDPDAMTGFETSFQGKKVFKQYSYELRRTTPRIDTLAPKPPAHADTDVWYVNPGKLYRMHIPPGWTVIDSDEKNGTDFLGRIDDLSVMLVCDREGIDVAGMSIEKVLGLFSDSFRKSLKNPVISRKDFHGMPAVSAVSFDAKKEVTTWTTLVLYKDRAYQLVTVATGKVQQKTEPQTAIDAWASFDWIAGVITTTTLRTPDAFEPKPAVPETVNPATTTVGVQLESMILPGPVNLPPIMNIAWLTAAQPSWGNLTAAIEGMSLLNGETTPERKKRFQKTWFPFFDCPQQPVDEYFGTLNPFLEDALCTRGSIVTAAEEFDAALAEAILAAAQGNDAAVLEALTIADSQKAILQGLNTRFESIASGVARLGLPPDPAELKRLAAERFKLALDVFKTDENPEEGVWTLTGIKKDDQPPTRKTGKTETGGSFAVSHVIGEYSYGVDASYSRTDSEDRLFKYDITAEATWMIPPLVLVPQEKITLSGQLRINPRKLGTREAGHFNPYLKISADLPGHSLCDWGIPITEDDATGMGTVTFGAGNSALILSEGKLVNVALSTTGIIPSGNGDGDILRIEVGFQAGNISKNVYAIGPLTYEFGQIHRIYTYTYKQKSAPKAQDDRLANDPQRVRDEQIQFHKDNIQAITKNIEFMTRDLEKMTGREERETQLFRIRCCQSDIQHEEDMIEYVRTGEYSHTRTAFEEYERYHFIASIRENQDNLKLIQRLASGAIRLQKLTPGSIGLKIAETVNKQKLLAIRDGDPERLRTVVAAINDQVTGYWEGERAKSDEKEIDARQNEFMAKLVVMGSGMVVTGGLTGGVSKLGILMGSLNASSGPIEDAPYKMLESAVGWSSMGGFVATEAMAGYEKGGLTGAAKSGASALVMGLSMEFAMNRLAKGFTSSGTFGPDHLTPEMVSEMAVWKAFKRETAQAETLIGKYQYFTNQLRHLPAGAKGAESAVKIEAELNLLAREVNSSYAAKLKLKGMGAAESSTTDRLLSFDFANRQTEINKVVRRDFEQAVKDRGLCWEKWDSAKGVWTKEELAFAEVRNSTSLGHNMDNDIRMIEYPLLEKVFDAERKVFTLRPVAKNLVERGGQRLPRYRLSQTVAEDGKIVSKSINTYDLNKELQMIYEGSYKKITGFDARAASQTVTTHINPESYTDIAFIEDLTKAENLKMLEGFGGQSAREVATFKGYHTGDPSMTPIMRRVSAARDTSKEIEKRLLPMLRGKTPSTPEARSRLEQQIETWENLKGAFDAYVEDPIRNYHRLSGLGQKSVPEVMEQVGTAIEAASKVQ